MSSADTREELMRIEQGENWDWTFAVLDSGSSLFPITGWTVDAKIKNRPGGDTLYTFPSPAAQIVGGGAFIKLTVPAAVSAAWTWSTGWYRVKIRESEPPADPDNPIVQRIIQGAVVMDLD